MGGITIDRDFPGGNIIVDGIQDDVITLRQDWHDNTEFWFYWCFRVRHAAGRSLRFVFSDGEVFGSMGPCFSADGATWQWLGRDVLDGLSFTYAFPEGLDEACFSFCMPYTEANLGSFLAGQTGIETSVLAMNELASLRR